MLDYLQKCNYMNLGCASCSPVNYDLGSRGYEMNSSRNQISYKNNVSVSPEYAEALKSQ